MIYFLLSLVVVVIIILGYIAIRFYYNSFRYKLFIPGFGFYKSGAADSNFKFVETAWSAFDFKDEGTVHLVAQLIEAKINLGELNRNNGGKPLELPFSVVNRLKKEMGERKCLD